MSTPDTLKWRFDVNTFRLIGRELITDRITAVFELVKNSYDANATRVDVKFENIGKKNPSSQITIEDNGTGMSFQDIKDKWMVVGTASKRLKSTSPPPFNRRYVGEKGIGRFAVDKLGAHLKIETKEAGSNKKLIVQIYWDEYEALSKSPQLTLFTDVENKYYYDPADIEQHGTKLTISSVNEIWTKNDVVRLDRELGKILSPVYPINPPFNIFLTSNEFQEFENKEIRNDATDLSSHHFVLNFDRQRKLQEILRFNKNTGKIYKDTTPFKIFGPISFDLYYFDQDAKRRYNATHKNEHSRIDGIKLYRDGLVTTPFAEFEAVRDKQRDILGIDKRLWTGIFDKIGSREIIGILNISRDLNPSIVEATNRQDFVDNAEYRQLKAFIIEQLDVVAELKKFERATKKLNAITALTKAGEDVKSFSKALEDIETEEPTLKQYLEPLRAQAKRVNESITKGISEQKKSQEEFIRKENIYFSLMSLQEYAIHLSHAVRTSLGKVKRMAEFFKDYFPNSEYDESFKQYAVLIYNEMNNLNKVIDFMLGYAGSNLDIEDFNVRDMLINLLSKSYSKTFESEEINVMVDIKDNFTINGNKKFFEDIFQNLISNSVKALKDSLEKIIKVSGSIEDNQFIVHFSDNGHGIPEEIKQKVFELYFTTTADIGGAGVGLFIAKTRVEAFRGVIEIIDSEFDPGTTFQIKFPFKKD